MRASRGLPAFLKSLIDPKRSISFLLRLLISSFLILPGCSRWACSPKEEVFSEKRFLATLEKKERLTPLSIDPMGTPSIIALASHKRATISEARRMMVVLDLCLTLEPLEEKPLLVISFLDSEGKFMGEGFVSQVVLRKNDLLVYAIDPTENSLRLIHKENFETSFGKAFGYDAVWQ